MKLKKGNSKKNSVSTSGILGRIFLISIASVLLILSVYNSIIIPKLLKDYSTCIKAKVNDNYYAGRYLGRRISYSFIFNNQEYAESFKVTEETKNLLIGDSICVVFLEFYPSINRPLSFFDEGEIKCNCK